MTQPGTPPIPPEALERIEVITGFLRMVGSRWIAQSIHVAAVLGISDALAGGPRTSEALAREVGAHPRALHRLLRALVTLGLYTQEEDGSFALGPRGALLRSDSRDSFRSWVLLMNGPRSVRAWGELLECVRTGETAGKLLEGSDNAFTSMAARPEDQATFDRSMAEGTRQVAGAVGLAYDFADVRTIVDVGGGHGALLPPILRAHPQMKGTVFDQPHCREGALRIFEKTRIADRCEFAGGSFFAAVPAGADVYILKSIIHDWDDERSIAILRACRAAMRADSRLLLVEVVVPERLSPTPAAQEIAAGDLNMLVSTGGLERTEREYRQLLEAAGLHLTRTAPTFVAYSVIEARPA